MMVINLPNFLTQPTLVALLEDLTPCMRGTFDFFYCPWDIAHNRNLGYAIVNFFSRDTAAEFGRQWTNQNLLPKSQCSMRLRIIPAALQGRASNIKHFSGFSLSQVDDPRFRPLIRSSMSEALKPMSLARELPQRPQPWAADFAYTDEPFFSKSADGRAARAEGPSAYLRMPRSDLLTVSALMPYTYGLPMQAGMIGQPRVTITYSFDLYQEERYW
jgi:hypothetical protein